MTATILHFPNATLNQPTAHAVTRALSDTQVFMPGKVYIVQTYEELGFVLEFSLDMENEGQKVTLDLLNIGTGGYRWPTAAQTTKEQADAILDMCRRVIREWPFDDIPVNLVRALYAYSTRMEIGQMDRAMCILKSEI